VELNTCHSRKTKRKSNYIRQLLKRIKTKAYSGQFLGDVRTKGVEDRLSTAVSAVFHLLLDKVRTLSWLVCPPYVVGQQLLKKKNTSMEIKKEKNIIPVQTFHAI
jgi:hypothetical protein